MLWNLISKEASRRRSRLFLLSISWLGSFVLSQPVPIEAQTVDVSGIRALIGACIMIFGSRLAGGCTSGYGISGILYFSIFSIITVIAMFGGVGGF